MVHCKPAVCRIPSVYPLSTLSFKNASNPPSLNILAFPNELLSHLFSFFDPFTQHRLGLPTRALNRRLANILRDPRRLATRMLRHFRVPEYALRAECGRIPPDMPTVTLVMRKCRRQPQTECLDAAIVGGCVDLVRMLMKRIDGCSWNTAAVAVKHGLDTTLTVPLLERTYVQRMMGINMAIVQGDYNEDCQLREELSRYVDSMMVDACRQGRVDLVQALTKVFGKHISSGALDVAAENGHLDTLRFLIDNGGDKLQNYSGQGFLKAAENGHLACVQYLLDAHPQWMSAEIRSSALKSAAHNGQLDVVRVFRAHHSHNMDIDAALVATCQDTVPDKTDLLEDEKDIVIADLAF
ncbi:hypothetical protein HDU93_006001 [Gonapodya sp. JEL0774]|nr:hypothetical protein HDU93_006001 [Gonapodya sp. JEL0774]